MSETVQGVTDSPAGLSENYEQVRFEVDPETNQARYFGEVAISEDVFLEARLSEEEEAEFKKAKPAVRGRTRATAGAKTSAAKSGSTKKTATARKSGASAKRSTTVPEPSAEPVAAEKLQSAHPELSEDVVETLAQLINEEVAKQVKVQVQAEVAKALKPLQEENARLKKQVEELESQLKEAKKEPAKEDRTASKAEKEAMEKSGSIYRTGDKLKIEGKDGYFEVISIPYKDKDGDWRQVVLINGQPQNMKVDDLKAWNTARRASSTSRSASADPAPTAPPAAPPAAPAAQVRKPRGWFGRRVMTDEEWTTYKERYQGRNRGAAILGALVGAVALGFIIHTHHEVEENEHTLAQLKNKPVIINKKTIIQKQHENTSTSTTEQPSTTTNEQEPPATNGSEENNGGTAPSPQNTPPTPESSPDKDEPLSGNGAFYGNFLPGGHGLALGYPKGARFERFSDGTAMITLQDGTTMNLHWNSIGKLTPATIRDIRSRGYDVGTTTGTFADREGRTFSHQYSVIGDKE